MHTEGLILAAWGAATVFVGWLALVSVVRQRRERETLTASIQSNVPDATPEEILEAQALGLIPSGQPVRPTPAK